MMVTTLICLRKAWGNRPCPPCPLLKFPLTNEAITLVGTTQEKKKKTTPEVDVPLGLLSGTQTAWDNKSKAWVAWEILMDQDDSELIPTFKSQ